MFVFKRSKCTVTKPRPIAKKQEEAKPVAVKKEKKIKPVEAIAVAEEAVKDAPKPRANKKAEPVAENKEEKTE